MGIGYNGRVYNWPKIKLDYINSDMSLQAFCKKINMRYESVYAHYRKEKWKLARAEFKQKTVDKYENKLINDNIKRWRKEHSINDRIDNHLIAILNEHGDLNNDGTENIKQPIEPDFLKKMAETSTNTLKNKKLIVGESIGDEKNLDIQSLIVQQIQINNSARQNQSEKSSIQRESAGLLEQPGHSGQSELLPEDIRE